MQKKPTPNVIAANIKYFMEYRGLSVDETAAAARMSTKTLYYKLAQPGKFQIEELEPLALKFGVSITRLLEDDQARDERIIKTLEGGKRYA